VGASSLTLQSNTCVLLNGAIQINGSTTASAAIKDGTSAKRISISGGIIDGGNLTGNNGISMSAASMAQIDAMTVRNFGPDNPRSGGSDSIHLSGGSTPYILTRCYVTNSSSRGIWLQLSGKKCIVSDCEVTAVNQDGVDCDSSTSGSVVKFNYCHDLVRYGVFFEQSAAHNVALGNVCNNDGRDINLYNNYATYRSPVQYNSVLCNSLMGNNGLRNGSTGTNTTVTSHNFLFNNSVINASINSEKEGSENYYSQNYQAGGSLNTAGTETFFNSVDVSSNLYVFDGSGLPTQAQGAATTNNTPVVIGPASGLDNDLWALIPTDSGYYRITNKKSKLVMAVSGASLSPGALIVQFSYGSGKNDQWMPMSAGNGLYYFINRLSGLCLNVPAAGIQLTQQPYTGGANQQFTLTLLAPTASSPFSLSALPLTQTVRAGTSTNYTITLTTNVGFTGSVTFGVSGLPTNTSAGFSPASLSTAGTTTLTINTSNSTTAGAYTLTITGTNSAATNAITVALTVVSPGSNLVWNSTSSTAWDTSALNWYNELTAGADVFQTGKSVVFADRAGVVTNITIASGVTVSPASTTVNADNADYSISGAGKISGTGDLIKAGSGSLTLTTTNDFTGKTFIQDGVLNINTETSLGGNPAALVTNQLTLNGGTLQTTTTFTIDDANRGITLGDNGGTFDVVSNTLTISKVFSGGSLRKRGSGTLVLGVANTYTGGSFVTAAGLRANVLGVYGYGPINVNGSGVAYLNAAGTYTNDFNIAGIGPDEASGNFGAIRFAANSSTATTLTGTITLTDTARMAARNISYSNPGGIVAGRVTGGGGLELGNSGDATNPGRITLSNPNNDWAGDTIIYHGMLRLGAPEVIPNGEGYGNVTIYNSNPTNDSILDLNGLNETINGFASGGSLGSRCIVTNSTSTNVAFTIGDNDAGGTFAGIIKNGAGAVAITKIGAGTEIFTGANTYTGATVVSNGTLVVNGSLANSPVTVMDGATVAGSGTIAGAVTVSPGGTIAPGNSLGILTINNSVTLQGTTVMELNQSLATNDVIRGVTTITYGGTLALTNLSGTLTTNDSFKLFAANTYSGAFATISPATPGAGLGWDTNSLTANGTLKITSTATPIPRLTGISLSGTTLMIMGTNGSAGGQFILLSSTNLALPLNLWTSLLTNNFDGNGNVNLSTNILNPSNAQQFYRLQTQ